MGFFTGSKGKHNQISTLTGSQRGIQSQLENAVKGGNQGGFGQAANYYRDLLSDDSSTFNAMQAPEQRRFNEQTIPDLAEQFAGMGSGGLSSSGFQNASVSAGTDLSERLGAIRAQLRAQGAQGLANLGQQSLQPVVENTYQPGSQGFLQQVAPALAQGAAAFATGGLSSLAGPAINSGMNWLTGANKYTQQANPGSASRIFG